MKYVSIFMSDVIEVELYGVHRAVNVASCFSGSLRRCWDG